VPDAPHVEFEQLSAAAGRDQGHEFVVGQADFLASVEIEVVGRGLDPIVRPPDGAVQQVVGRDQTTVDGVAQMRQINAAERPMPVAAVALAAIQLNASLLDQLGVDRIADRRRVERLAKPAADHHHPRVHVVGFGIFHLEIAPEAAANHWPNRCPSRIVSHFARHALILGQFLERQRPFGHLAVTAIGQVNFSDRRDVVERLGQRRNVNPLLVLRQGVEKPR